jgi:hypothetical protein
VNIFPQMTSLYVWEGKLHEDGESAMIIKTTRGRSAEVLEEIKRLASLFDSGAPGAARRRRRRGFPALDRGPMLRGAVI